MAVPKIDSVPIGRLCCHDELSSEQRDAKVSYEHNIERLFESNIAAEPSKYRRFQLLALREKYQNGEPLPAVADSTFSQSTERTVAAAQQTAFCRCRFCRNYTEPGYKPSRALELLVVCEQIYLATRHLPFTENSFYFERSEDLAKLLSSLSLGQRWDLRKIQVAWRVVVLLGDDDEEDKDATLLRLAGEGGVRALEHA